MHMYSEVGGKVYCGDGVDWLAMDLLCPRFAGCNRGRERGREGRRSLVCLFAQVCVPGERLRRCWLGEGDGWMGFLMS